MRRRAAEAWMMAGALAALTLAPGLYAQAAGAGQKQQPTQNAPAQNTNGPAQNTDKPAQDNGNPFPGDVNSVPVMPSGNEPDFSADMNGEGHAAAPAVDNDPVRTPEDEAPGGSDSTQGFSSSQSGLANITAPPDEPQRKGKKGDDSLTEPFPRETPKQDMSVGDYYLSIHNWKGALSRYQSAMVLAPDNPDVYWGMAECQRHLGMYAEARANYLKVMEYDPDSRHAKEAKKLLKDPDIANAKPAEGQGHK